MKRAVGVLIRKGNKVLLVRQARRAVRHAGLWGPPGGRVGEGESFEEAAVREVREEAGLVVELGEVIWRGVMIDKWENKVECKFFKARVMGGNLGGSEDDNTDKVRWVGRREIEESKFPLRIKVLKEILLDGMAGRRMRVKKFRVEVEI